LKQNALLEKEKLKQKGDTERENIKLSQEKVRLSQEQIRLTQDRF